MATKNTFLFNLYLLLLSFPVICMALPEESEFKVRRDYLKSRYEDFFLHYDFIDHYEILKSRGKDQVKAERLNEEREKGQARVEFLKTRKLPGPYREIEDGTNNKEDQKAKELARKEFLNRRETLQRLEKTVQKIPPEIETGLENIER